MEERVVLVLEGSTQVKGLVESFDPSSESIRIERVDDEGRLGEPLDVAVDRIRAAFFVHDLAPYRRYRMPERMGPPTAQVGPLNGEIRMRLQLEWGQWLHGLVRPRDDAARWYDFVPLGSDRAGNLIRAVIAVDAIVEAEPVEVD